MNFTREIDLCQRYIDEGFSSRLNSVGKPFVNFQVEEIWKPK